MEELRITEDKLAELRQGDEKRKKFQAATAIQKVFRAHRSRAVLGPWLLERRQVLFDRKADNGVRTGIAHTTLTMLGVAPALPSDTPMEYTMRLFPWYMKATVLDCVSRDWSTSAELAGYHKDHKRRGVLEGIQTFASLSSQTRRVRMLRRNLTAKAAHYDRCKQLYIQVVHNIWSMAIKLTWIL